MNPDDKRPTKLFVQDVFRAQRIGGSLYELFGIKFKSVMLHGVVTELYETVGNSYPKAVLSDATGAIAFFYKIPSNKNPFCFKNMPLPLLSTKLELLKPGCFASIFGEITLSEKNVRMINVYEYYISSAERDVVWMEELSYLYEKYYLWVKESIS